MPPSPRNPARLRPSPLSHSHTHVPLPQFGEGIALLGNRLYQLTWTSEVRQLGHHIELNDFSRIFPAQLRAHQPIPCDVCSPGCQFLIGCRLAPVIFRGIRSATSGMPRLSWRPGCCSRSARSATAAKGGGSATITAASSCRTARPPWSSGTRRRSRSPGSSPSGCAATSTWRLAFTFRLDGLLHAHAHAHRMLIGPMDCLLGAP